MSINHELKDTGELPKRIIPQNEKLILRRDFVKFDVIIDKIGTFKGDGRVVLTSRRIVLININGSKEEKNKDPFLAFELPIHKIEKE